MSKDVLVRLYKNYVVEIYYSYKYKTLYISPPVKVSFKLQIEKEVKDQGYEIENIVVGRPYERYL